MTNFRNVIDSSLLKYKIEKEENKWYQLCSSMNCIEDNQLAINYYKKSKFPKPEGENFIFFYGGQYLY